MCGTLGFQFNQDTTRELLLVLKPAMTGKTHQLYIYFKRFIFGTGKFSASSNTLATLVLKEGGPQRITVTAW
jgi:hypothetical protein